MLDHPRPLHDVRGKGLPATNPLLERDGRIVGIALRPQAFQQGAEDRSLFAPGSPQIDLADIHLHVEVRSGLNRARSSALA